MMTLILAVMALLAAVAYGFELEGIENCHNKVSPLQDVCAH